MNINYFLGSNSYYGFYSLYDDLVCSPLVDRLYIIKGGAGCGKSSFMKTISKAAEDAGLDVEKVLCSGDPDSLDGIFIPRLRIAYVDGTAPHAAVPNSYDIKQKKLELKLNFDIIVIFMYENHYRKELLIMYEIFNVGAERGSEAFLLITEGGTALIDSGFAFCADEMINNAEKHLNGRSLDCILLTHSHYDHASGVPYCREKWPDVKVYAAAYAKRVFERPGALKTIREMNDNAASIHSRHAYRRLDKGLSVDISLADGDVVTVGNMSFTVIETPGHTKDCISFWCESERLLISSETIGYPLLPDKVNPTFLVGYQMTIDSIRRLRELGAEKQLVSHKGIVDKPFIDEFLVKSEIWMNKTKDMVLKAHADGLDNNAIMAVLKKEFYNGKITTLQPEKAYDLNCYYMVNMIIRECAPQA